MLEGQSFDSGRLTRTKVDFILTGFYSHYHERTIDDTNQSSDRLVQLEESGEKYK